LYYIGINNGNVEEPWSSRKIGPLNHARWLTLAIRLMCLFTRMKKALINLKRIVKFIVTVYVPAWFSIKPAKLHNIPQIVSDTIKNIKSLRDNELQDLCFKNFQGNMYGLLPNNFIYALIKSEYRNVRRRGWESIRRLRAHKLEHGEPSVLPNKIPKINFSATNWFDLVSLNDLIVEPCDTTRIADEDIEKLSLSGDPVQIETYPCHSQSVERAVRLVSWASQCVYGTSSRHQAITCTMLCNDARPQFNSKCEYVNSVSEVFYPE